MSDLPLTEDQNSPIQTNNTPVNFQPPQHGTYEQLNQLFNQENQQTKTIQEARDILGESAKSLTDGQVNDLVNEIQYLVDTWLEEYEQKVFDGKTLKEVLQINL